MKNLHLIPTDKPSRLYLNTKEYIFENEYSLSTDECRNKNIYITSDEEIKEGDYYITPNNTVLKALGLMLINVEDYKKIILTTDQDLIKDGVQPIPDEFLEWFVKNPVCEFVEVDKLLIYKPFNEERDIPQFSHYEYKIYLSKEETKQETLEEAVKKYCIKKYSVWVSDSDKSDDFINGAKWQQEQDKKCYHPLPYRLAKSDVNYECTLCGKFI